MNKDEQFLNDLAKLQPEQVLGLARVCHVKILEDKVENGHAVPRLGETIVREILEVYANSSRAERRWLAEVVHESLSKKK